MQRLADDLVRDRSLQAAVDDGLVENGEGALDARDRPRRDLARDGGLPLEEDRGADDALGIGALVEERPRAVQEIEVAERRAGDDEAGVPAAISRR